jgi:hypothetical protein
LNRSEKARSRGPQKSGHTGSEHLAKEDLEYSPLGLLKNPRNAFYVILTVRLCSPFDFVQGDPEFIEGSPSLSEAEGSEVPPLAGRNKESNNFNKL